MRSDGVCIVKGDVGRRRESYRDVLQVGSEGDDENGSVALRTEVAKPSLIAERGNEQMGPGSMTGTGRGGCALEYPLGEVDRVLERL
jgi:hypothetical protein